MPDLPISDVVSFSSEDPVKSIYRTAAESPGEDATFRRPTAPRISSKRTPFASGIARRPEKSKHPSYSRQNAFLRKFSRDVDFNSSKKRAKYTESISVKLKHFIKNCLLESRSRKRLVGFYRSFGEPLQLR